MTPLSRRTLVGALAALPLVQAVRAQDSRWAEPLADFHRRRADYLLYT